MRSKKTALILIALLSALLLVFLCKIIGKNSPFAEPPLPASTPDTAKTVERKSPDEAPSYVLHPDMQAALDSLSASVDELDGCSQLIVVGAVGSSAELVCYEVKDGKWTQGETYPAHVGYNGVSSEKIEGDQKTPCGLYRIGFAFGNKEKPDTVLPYRKISENSYWVDDPLSEHYNTWVEASEKKDWRSAEHLSEYYSAYSYAAVIEYNTDPIVPNAGSAIFLHCGEAPTAGCVSVSEENMLKILSWFESDSNPMILIYAETR